MEYFRACRIHFVVFFFILYLLSKVVAIGSSYWLTFWTNHSEDPETADRTKYLYYLVYAVIGALLCVLSFASDFVLFYMYFYATKILHNKMLHSILRSTMEFFESTPSGRIINRFSKDVEATERGIPESFKSFCRYFFQFVSTIIVITFSTPLFITVLIPIIIIYIFIQVENFFCLILYKSKII